MKKQIVQYIDTIPFHIRPIGLFVDIVKQSGCDVTLSKGDLRVNGHKAMQILRLEIVPNDIVSIEVDGPNESDVLHQLVQVVMGIKS